MEKHNLLHAGCVHCDDFPSYICANCLSLVCKYCQNDHKCIDDFHKGGQIKCWSHGVELNET